MRLKVLKENSDTALGKNSEVPSREEVERGDASYGGLPIIYKPGRHEEASNHETEIWVSDKFFNYDIDIQRHILNHEVAHNLSDQLMSDNTGRWQEFCKAFIEERKTPVSSTAYKNGSRTYWVGLYGDIGANSLSETVTRAITEYLDDPERLKSRSEEAFSIIEDFMRLR